MKYDLSKIPATGGDYTQAIQHAINELKIRGGGVLHIPAGTWMIHNTIDLTGCSNLTITGEGFGSVLRCYAHIPGSVFECTGANALTFRDFQVFGVEESRPQSAFLLARGVANGSAGRHLFSHVMVSGYFTKSSIASISSEANTYRDCEINNYADDAICLALLEQNGLELVPRCQSFPQVFSGGNTVHNIFGGILQSNGSGGNGGCLSIDNARHVMLSGTFFNSFGGEYGVKLSKRVDCLTITGMSGEVGPSKCGILLDSDCFLTDSFMQGRLDKGIVGKDGSQINQCTIDGVWSSPICMDLDTIENSMVMLHGLTMKAKKRTNVTVKK